MKKTIKVVAAIIENNENEILCALRSPSMSLPNLWEFPGGKVEPGENINTALEREIEEELGCRIKALEVFCDTVHEYDSFKINLICITSSIISGEPIASEHSKLIWLKPENLQSLKWASADISAVKKLMPTKKELVN